MTPPYDTEEYVGDEDDDKSDRNYEEKEAKCPDVTPTDDKEKGVGEEKVDKNERNYDEKKEKWQID